ncbi:MAG: Maf family protein [Gammaproteobacteria bacterium]|nr:Maf family protein [Gammaproteobacteria bacterium]
MERAQQQLRGISSGREVRFLTGLCVWAATSGRLLSGVETCTVHLREPSVHAAIRDYVRREQPLDCAGSFWVANARHRAVPFCSSSTIPPCSKASAPIRTVSFSSTSAWPYCSIDARPAPLIADPALLPVEDLRQRIDDRWRWRR